MNRIGVLFTLVCGAVAVSACTQTGGTAFADNKRESIRLCTSTVANRTGSGNVELIRTSSRELVTQVWVRAAGQPFECVVEKNGPNSYYIRSVRRW